MKVACEHCGSVYEIQDDKIPAGGMTMKCPKCLRSFHVAPPVRAELDKGRTILGMGAAVAPSKSSGASPSASDLYVKRFTGRVFGPFPVDVIREMLAEGKLDGTEQVSEDRESWVSIRDYEALGGGGGAGVDLPSPKGAGVDLPSPKGAGVDLPSPKGAGVDLPSPKGAGVDLPSPKGAGVDLPSPKGAGVDLPSSKGAGVDLPSSKGAGVDLPSSKGAGVDLPSPKGAGVDLPSPKGAGVDLPSPKGAGVDLPSPKGAGVDLPSPKGAGVDLPSPADLPRAVGEGGRPEGRAGSPPPVPATAGRPREGGLDLSELDLLGDVEAEADRETGARELDLGVEPPVGATPLDLGELDSGVEGTREGASQEELGGEVPAPGKGEAVGQETRGAAEAERKDLLGGVSHRLAGFGRTTWLLIGGGVGLGVVLVVVGLLLLRRSGGGHGRKKRAARRPRPRPMLRVNLDGCRSDRPEGYLAVVQKVMQAPGAEPQVRAVGVQAAFFLRIHFGVKGKAYRWAKKAAGQLRQAQVRHPELEKALALELLARKKKGAKGLADLCRRFRSDAWSCVYWCWGELVRGRFDRAEKACRTALKRDERNAAAWFGLAQAQAGQGRWKEAARAARACQKRSKAHLEAALLRLWAKAETYEEAGKWSEKKWNRLWAEVESLDKRVSQATLGQQWLSGRLAFLRGRLLDARGREDEALKWYRTARKTWKTPWSKMAYGWKLLAYGRYGEAEHLFDLVLKRWKHSERAFEGKVRSVLGSGRAEEALHLVRSRWEEWGDQAWMRVLRGDVNLARGKRKSAEKFYKKAVAADAKYAPAYERWIGLRLGTDPQAGLVQLDQLSAQGIDSLGLRLLAGRLYEALGKWREAVGVYEREAKRHPWNNEVLLALGRAYVKSGRQADGQRLLERIFQRARGHRGVGRALAEVYLAAGAADRAMKVLEETLVVRPTPEVRLALAWACLRRGGKKAISRAMALGVELVKARPQDPKTHRVLGRAYLLAKRYDEALGELRKAASALPRDVEVRLWMAKAYAGLTQVGRALAVLGEALVIDPNHPQVLLYRAKLAISRGDVRAALKDLSKVVRKHPSAEAYVLQAEAYMERQRPTQALRALKRAVRLDPGYPKAYFLLGKLSYLGEKLPAAMANLKKAVTLGEEAKPHWLADAYYMLGSSAYELRRRAEAKKYLRKYLAVTKGEAGRETTRREAARKLARLEGP